MKTRNQLCQSLSYAQIRPDTLTQVRFDLHHGEFSLLFEEYDPNKILKNGSYLSQLERVLKVFKPALPSPYKKITKAVFLSARYLSSFESYDDFVAKVKEETKDERSRYLFLERFHVSSHLSSMYFNRACKFFQETSILDVPYLDKETKEKARSYFSLPDDNEKLFFALLHQAKKENISCKKRQDKLRKR